MMMGQVIAYHTDRSSTNFFNIFLAGWSPESVWTQRLEEKSLRLCWGSNLDHPFVQPIARHYTYWATRLTVEWYWQVKIIELREKPVPVLLCPPQIPFLWTDLGVNPDLCGERLATNCLSHSMALLRLRMCRCFLFISICLQGMYLLKHGGKLYV
jgi:hypothetical protein